ncbi:hypothetical protein F1643_18170 [Azospirillum sp. INR13]|uniref:hypothetical protein n=1 Tax=Azospirillum sp. INR13 TaxID=2596919 RepID=UPI0018925EE4|nr:hypothetical protein [Azospirillum sp. INR13]MBF5096018.1 hypothetical protein [Azospirillum sp. INR13]
MTLVAQFLKHPGDLEIFWLAGFRKTLDHKWQTLAVTSDIDAGTLRKWWLPMGLLPLLAPGYAFIRGCRSTVPRRGRAMPLQIDDVGAGEEVTSAEIPPELYSFGKRKRGVQRLLRYCQGGMDILVPTIELVRYLFLHNKTMANTLMRPDGIMELFCPEEPGFQSNLHLRFTRGMPRSCLSDAFVSEFAWIAVAPEGRRSWDSVRDRTVGRPHVSLTPPSLRESCWMVRAVEWEETILVLEILSMTGKRFPCDVLRYSHPSIRKTKPFRSVGAKQHHQDKDGAATTVEPVNAYDPEIDVTATGSRANARQTALHVPGKLGTFDRIVPIERVILEARPPSESSDDTAARAPSRPQRDRRNPRRLRSAVSVAEEDSSDALPPIEFRLLEPAGPDEVGELEPMMTVIRLMANALPTVQVASSLCLLKPGRAFSLIGRHRRPCLTALFTPKTGIPLVLLNVDHSGEHALSSLALTYRRPCAFREIEEHLAALLGGLVDAGGHWDTDAVRKWNDLVMVKRLPRVLRCRDRLADADYLAAWAERLSVRLGFVEVNE